MSGTIEIRRWLVSRVSADTWGTPVAEPRAYDKALALSKASRGPYHLKLREDPRWGPARNFVELKDALTKRMNTLRLGEVLLIDNSKVRTETVRLRRCLIDVDPLDLSNCTETCEVIIFWLRETYPTHLNFGWYNCRRVAGSTTWSQHAWGNAYDAGGTLNLVRTMGNALVAQAKRGALPIAQVIFDHQVWEPDTGLRPYNGVDPHTGHVHITARPQMPGTPPCA